ncbi:putative Ig domain-containing protein [Microbacterium sp. CPCC 204701]|uniref:putative Ig domain-containing protein n=1 Tax=Microbacterium sp. CPCC 204701 TaxID=2493084 RepID=UPI000FDB037A|nr:putative Ig domain-containing protein [Microbacterium sp. CPCC 204701]
MRTKRPLTAVIAVFTLVLGTISLAAGTAIALPSQPGAGVPPIIGNSLNGVIRDVPAEYYRAIEDFENRAIAEVIETHSLPESDWDAVRAWGRDAVRAQAFLNLLAIIKTPANERTDDEKLVYRWFQEVYQDQLVDQAQEAVDLYLQWSGLTLDTISLDPQPDNGSGGGYCNFHPPKVFEKGSGAFGGVYNATMLPQCHDSQGTTVACLHGPTGCPVPWPTAEQFQQWGRYLSQQELFDDPVFPNLAMDASVGIGVAATLAATAAGTAAARAYLAVPVAAESGTLFTKVFPHTARAFIKLVKGAVSIPQVVTEAAGTTARASAGVVRAGAGAFVVGTVITAILTIALESWTIYEHSQIPVKLQDWLEDAKDEVPNLASILAEDSGPGVLLTTFISTTQIDVDYDCRPVTGADGYSAFPCANAPAPPAPTDTDPRLYITRAGADDAVSGGFEDRVYLMNPIDSDWPNATLNEAVRPSGNGWFVTTKYDGLLAGNRSGPAIPGASLQTLRLYYVDWDGQGRVAERIVVDGRPKFAISSLESPDVTGCTEITPESSDTTMANVCLTDTISYLEPDGTKASARIVAHDAAGPAVNAIVPDRVFAGEPFVVSASTTATFGSEPFEYRWTVGGQSYDGASVRLTSNYAGPVEVQLDVTDAEGETTTERYPVLAVQTTTLDVAYWPTIDPVTWPAGPVATGETTTKVWAKLTPAFEQGVQCAPMSVIDCTEPTGAVQFYLNGIPVGAPVTVGGGFYMPPCFEGPPNMNCVGSGGLNVAWARAIPVPFLGLTPGVDAQLSAVYHGDANFKISSGAVSLTVAKAPAVVSFTSGSTYPDPDVPVTLTASVTAPPTIWGVPTGYVQFREGEQGSPLGDPAPLDATGTAILHDLRLRFVNSVVVEYLGDDRFAETSSSVTPIRFPVATSATVDPPPTSALAGTLIPLSITVRDELDEPMPNVEVIVSPGDHRTTTDANGVATVSVSSEVDGEVTYTVAADGASDLASATILWASVPGFGDLDTELDAEVGVPFEARLPVAGVPTPTIDLTGLPDWLTFDEERGVLSGTPPENSQAALAPTTFVAATTAAVTTAAVTTTTITAIATSPFGTATAQLVLSVHPAVAIVTDELPPATATRSYKARVVAEGGFGPYRWAVEGLPDGLALDADAGIISGTPVRTSSQPIELTVIDALGGTRSAAVHFAVAAAPVKPSDPVDSESRLAGTGVEPGFGAVVALLLLGAGLAALVAGRPRRTQRR